MANSDEKVSKFVQAITAYAEEQRQRIHQEVEDFKAERLMQAEQQVLADVYELIQKERTQLRSQASREISRRELEARKKLLSKRQGMMDAVFAAAEEQIAAFAASPDYAAFLQASLQAMSRRLPAEGTVYQLATRDAGHVQALAALCPEGSRVELSDDIRLGGLRGVNAAAGLLADDSLDARLDEQRDWFETTSGLTMD